MPLHSRYCICHIGGMNRSVSNIRVVAASYKKMQMFDRLSSDQPQNYKTNPTAFAPVPSPALRLLAFSLSGRNIVDYDACNSTGNLFTLPVSLTISFCKIKQQTAT